MAKIKEILEESNPWWKEEFKLQFKDREIYHKLQKFIPLPQIIALTGLRRVGKTTLMYKIIDDTIKKGIDPRNILYVSFDEFKEVELRQVIKEYEELMEKEFRKEKYLLLLDEVQKVKDWENQLKSIYDQFKDNTKIIISGSESLFIKKKSKETLAGRIFEFRVDPLSFREFLLFKEATFEPMALYERELINLFNEFTLNLGFPELVGIKDKEIIKKYIQEGIIEKILYKDIPKLFKIKDITVLEALLNIFLEEPGQLVDISKLANDLNISRQTLSRYLEYLEEAFLLRKVYNFSKSRRKVERKLKKYYPTVVSVDLLFKEDDVSKSKVFECLIINQLGVEFFWRDPYKNEVDAILADEKIQPIEIKYGKIDFHGLLRFMKKFKLNESYIISYKAEEKQRIDNKTIFIVPAFKFLLKLLPRQRP